MLKKLYHRLFKMRYLTHENIVYKDSPQYPYSVVWIENNGVMLSGHTQILSWDQLKKDCMFSNGKQIDF